MQLGNYWTHIACNDVPLEEYSPFHGSDGRTVTCYINSQAGHAFDIDIGTGSQIWTDEIELRLYADGRLLANRICEPGYRYYRVSGMRVSQTERRPFEFAYQSGKPVEEMDEDDDKTEMTDPHWRDKGTITLELSKVKIRYSSDRDYTIPATYPTRDITGLRTVQLGQTILKEVAPDHRRPIDCIVREHPDVPPFAVFQWQHRDLNFLQQYQFIQGINSASAPPPSATILPEFAELSVNARGWNISELTSHVSGMSLNSGQDTQHLFPSAP